MRPDNLMRPDPRRENRPQTWHRVAEAPFGTLQRTGLGNNFACNFNAYRRAFADFEQWLDENLGATAKRGNAAPTGDQDRRQPRVSNGAGAQTRQFDLRFDDRAILD